MEKNIIYNEDCISGMNRIPDNSIDVVCTDPPYLYLKNQKLDRYFDESAFFAQVKRVLKKDGFIIMFGRGTSFYRWNTSLSELGFTFKEEFVWDKGYCTSPLMPISRIHETISIHTLGKGSIIKQKIPYLEMKKYNIPGILQDLCRIKTILKSPVSLLAVENFLKNNTVVSEGSCNPNYTSVSSEINVQNRCASVMRAIDEGCNEKSIIRTDLNKKTGDGLTGASKNQGSRCVTVAQAIEKGMNEKSIIKETPNHYKAIHPTEKPVRLIERLLNLVCKEDAIVLDPFSGSASTAIACIKTKREYIGFEIDKEYWDLSQRRILEASKEPTLNFE